MVILIFRKFCFQPRSPGGLFLRNSGYLFYSKFMRSAPPSVPNIQSQHWYLHLSRDTHENTRASTHSKIPRKMSNPPPDQQTAPRGTRNQHLGQLCAGETGTSLLPPRGQAPADSGRNRSTAISSGYDVFAAGQARAAAYQAAYQAAAGGGSGNKGDKDEEGSYSDSSCDIDVDGTETLDLSPATRKLLSPSTLAQVDRHYAPGQKKNTAKRYSTDEHDGDQVRCISLRRSACWTYNAHR